MGQHGNSPGEGQGPRFARRGDRWQALCRDVRQSAEDHRETFVRSVPGGRCPLGRLSGRREGLDRGDQGGERAAPTVGQDLGCLKSRGWRRAFTLRSYFQPCPPLLLPLPPRPLPRWHDSAGGTKGAGERRAGDMRDRLGTARAHDPRKSRPGPRNRLQAIALGHVCLTGRNPSGLGAADLKSTAPLHDGGRHGSDCGTDGTLRGRACADRR